MAPSPVRPAQSGRPCRCSRRKRRSPFVAAHRGRGSVAPTKQHSLEPLQSPALACLLDSYKVEAGNYVGDPGEFSVFTATVAELAKVPASYRGLVGRLLGRMVAPAEREG